MKLRGDVTSKLTNRELAILKLVARGLNYRQIADYFQNAEPTVRNHMSVVRIKLNATNAPHAVAIAKDKGLI